MIVVMCIKKTKPLIPYIYIFFYGTLLVEVFFGSVPGKKYPVTPAIEEFPVPWSIWSAGKKAYLSC